MSRTSRGRRHGGRQPEHEPLNAVVWRQEHNARNQSIEDVVTFTTPKELYSLDHSYVTDFLKSSSIHKLGEMTVQDHTALLKLGDKPLLTLGSSNPNFDWQAAWRQVLGVGQHDQRRAVDWGNTVTVEAWVLTVKDAIAPDHEGLLYPILKGYQTGGVSLSMFGLPSMQAVVDFKWKTFARTFVYGELLFLLLWVLSFTTLGLIISQPGSSLEPTGIWVQVAHLCNILSAIAMLPFVLIELANIVDYRLAWLNMWNATELISCVLQAIFFWAHLKGDLDEPWVSSLMAVQNLLLWLRLFFLARAVQTSKKVSLVDILALVFLEIRDFITLCAMLLWAFAFSFHVLFRMDSVSAFRYMGESLMNVLKWMKAGSDMGIISVVKTHELATCLLLVLFQLVMAMMMMSLLIGVVNRSVTKAGENQELKAYAAQAVIMIDLECTLPSWIECLFPKAWYPKYLHVLRIKPSSLAVVDSKYTWKSSRAVTRHPSAGHLATAPSQPSAPPAPQPAPAAAASASEVASLTSELKELKSTLQAQTQLIHKLLATSSADKPAAT